jgi:Bacterial Ig-like domain (group 3)/Pentapeptide repeats (8 copies)
MRDLGALGGTFSQAVGVSGDIVVGYADTASGDIHATAWSLATAAATNTMVTSSASPAAAGRPVTFVATVAPAPAGGTVAFSDKGVPVLGCQSVPLSGSTAACTVTYPVAGAHSLVAAYSGASGFAASTSPALTDVVSKTPCPSLVGCNLSGVNLSGIDLSGADLSGANLNRVNFSRADLSGADLSGANLNSVNFSGANLSGADLSRANLNGVIWSSTICPDGTNSNTDSNTCQRHL